MNTNHKKLHDNQSRINSNDIDACTSEEEIQKMKTTIEANLCLVKSQLDTAEGKVAATGEYSDPQWYARAKSYKRVLGYLHQRILIKQREFKAKKLSVQQKTMEKIFMDCARCILPEDTFYQIYEDAKSKFALLNE